LSNLPEEVLFDASALVALSRRERGSDQLKMIVDNVKVRIASTTSPEALSSLRRKGSTRTRDELLEDWRRLGIKVEPVTEDDGEEAAYLLELSVRQLGDDPRKGGLSLGDALCLAVGKRLDIPVVASDGSWEIFESRGITVLPFR
jgi:PIN domain nuclease of toxin-antitoxin system